VYTILQRSQAAPRQINQQFSLRDSHPHNHPSNLARNPWLIPRPSQRVSRRRRLARSQLVSRLARRVHALLTDHLRSPRHSRVRLQLINLRVDLQYNRPCSPALSRQYSLRRSQARVPHLNHHFARAQSQRLLIFHLLNPLHSPLSVPHLGQVLNHPQPPAPDPLRRLLVPLLLQLQQPVRLRQCLLRPFQRRILPVSLPCSRQPPQHQFRR
jgi:hypothetical protein